MTDNRLFIRLERGSAEREHEDVQGGEGDAAGSDDR